MKKKYTEPAIKYLKLDESFLFKSTDILNSLDSLIFTPVFASGGDGGCGGDTSGGGCGGGCGGDTSGGGTGGGCGDCES